MAFCRYIAFSVFALLNITFILLRGGDDSNVLGGDDSNVYVFGNENHPSCFLFTVNFWRSAGTMCMCAYNVLVQSMKFQQSVLKMA